MSAPPPTIQIAANAPGWGHWTRVLALVTYLPQFHIKLYHRMGKVLIPQWIRNVEVVATLETGIPLICEYGWEACRPYQPSDFPHSLCVRKISRQRPDEAGYDRILTISDLDQIGDFPPTVLETPALTQPFDSHIIVASETRNHAFLKEKYPTYSQKIVYPITTMRRSIQHLVGIGSYNLFWECVYYQIPCTFYPSTWKNDSNWRLAHLGDRPLPDPFVNGAPEVAKAMAEWWLSLWDG